MPRLQVLNPNVLVKADSGKVEEKSDEYFTQFDVVCATCCTTDILVRSSPTVKLSRSGEISSLLVYPVCFMYWYVVNDKVFPISS